MNDSTVFPKAALLALPLLAAVSPLSATEENPYDTRYPRAVIEYEVRMEQGHTEHAQTVVGEQVIYLDGERLAKDIKLRMDDGDQHSHVREIHTREYIVAIDMLAGEGVRHDNPNGQVRRAFDRLSEDAKREFNQRVEKRGVVSFDLPYLGRQSGTDEVLGHRCVVYSHGSKVDMPPAALTLAGAKANGRMETCLWKGVVPLRLVMSGVGGKHTLEARAIRLDGELDEERFEEQFRIPADVEVSYNAWRSEAERRFARARFESYLNGAPMVVRVPMDGAGGGAEPTSEND